MLIFGIIAFYIYFHYLICHVMTCPFTYYQAKKSQISFLHFRIWQSWQKLMSIFWSWIKTRKRLFPTFVQTLVQNMSFYCTVNSSFNRIGILEASRGVWLSEIWNMMKRGEYFFMKQIHFTENYSTSKLSENSQL